jgi:CrcB protein
MTAPSTAAGVTAAALGGALGAVARWALGEAFPAHGDAFPWVVFAINVVGSGLLAGVPALAVARSRPVVAVFLGTGVLGGFTTMSTASVDTFTLLEHGAVGTALAYALGTLVAALVAVVLVDRLSTPAQRRLVEDDEGDR